MAKRILCIDGRPDLVELVKDILEYGDYAVLTRLAPYCSISEIEALHPNLVIVGLADVVGRETLKLLKPTTMPVLALYRDPYRFMEQDQELVNENTTLVRNLWDIDDLLRIVEEAVQSQTEYECFKQE